MRAGPNAANPSRRAGLGPRLAGLAALALALVCPLRAAAAPLPPAPLPPAPLSREALNPATAPPESRKLPRDVLAPPPDGPCPIDVPGLTFQLKAVKFVGASTARPRDLAGAYARQLNTTITLRDVCRIRDAASRLLFQRGIIARVDVPPQKIADGTLTLAITQAVITSVEVQGSPAHIVARVKAMMTPYQGRVFDAHRFARDLALANDLPGVSVSPTLHIRPEVQGGMDLILTVQHRPFSVLGTAQNTSTRATGRETVTTHIDFNSLTPLGEQNTLVAQDTPTTHRQQVIQWIGEARPLPGGWVFRGSASVGRSRPGGAISPLSIVSDNVVATASVSYPLIRNQQQGVTLTAGMEWVDQHTNLFKSEVFSKDHLRIAYLQADGRQDWTAAGPVPRGSATVLAQVRQGLRGLGASSADNPLTSRSGGAPDALDLRETGRLDLIWTPRIRSLLSLTAQQSGDPVMSYEGLSAGSLSVGRGYDPSIISGDRGVMGSAELHLGPASWPQALSPLRSLTRELSIDGLVFFDAAYVARVATASTDASHASLRSAGAGISAQLGPRLRADITYAKPLDSLSKAAGHPPPGRWLVQLVAIGF